MKKISIATNLILILILLIPMIATIIYNIYDNNRVVVVKQEVPIEGLPDSFDGFTILQITDLHGKRFGVKQKNLLNVVNNLNYDMIAITGDILDRLDKDTEPFIEVIDGIKNKSNMFYITGNNDPEIYDLKTGIRTEIGKKFEEKGCILLDKPYSIKRNKDTLWVLEFYQSFNKDEKEEMKAMLKGIKAEDLKIGLTHYPRQQHMYENFSDSILLDYNLILAGHYHGGQYRIPFLGAFFIPNVYGDRLFPKQNEVSGLNQWNNYNQYVSRGLGASSKASHWFKLVKFRLFNTPEVNLITLVKKK